MKVVFATLAEHAQALDGKFYILGGDLRVVQPKVHAHLSLAIRVEFDDSELGREHQLDIASDGPAGEPFTSPYSLRVKAPATAPLAGAPVTFAFVYIMENVSLTDVGKYALTVRSGTVDLTAVPFHVLPPQPVEAAASPPAWKTRLDDASVAFGDGDLDRAIGLLRDLADDFPDLAIARNNLGFILLVKGNIRAAAVLLEEAGTLHFDRQELLYANLAVCSFVLGNSARASELFAACLERGRFTEPSILLGINGDQRFVQNLASAAEYSDLMALNLAWARRAVGDLPAASTALARARLSQLNARSAEFATSVRSLTALLGTAPAEDKPTSEEA